MLRTFLVILIAAASSLLASLPASSFQTSGQSLIVIDHASGAVLAEKNPDLPLPPASMSKLMTMNMVFEALAEGRLTLDFKLPVSQHAASYKGSSMFLRRGERISVLDLIRGVIVLSGNDASAVLAEALSPDGTEMGFARLMNARAVELGLTNSHFANSNGWPDPTQRMSARDLARLASRLIRDFPVYYRYFSETEYGFDERVPDNRFNRNPLLSLGIGADGLKTGYTRDAGYGLVGSAVRDGRRVVFVISGLDSRSVRTAEAEQIVNWYFIHFARKVLFSQGETVLQVPLWMGDETHLPVTVGEDAAVLVRSASADDIEAEAVFQQPFQAPIAEGQVVGELRVTVPGLSGETVFPLVAAQSIDRSGILGRLTLAARRMFTRFVTDRLLGS